MARTPFSICAVANLTVASTERTQGLSSIFGHPRNQSRSSPPLIRAIFASDYPQPNFSRAVAQWLPSADSNSAASVSSTVGGGEERARLRHSRRTVTGPLLLSG